MTYIRARRWAALALTAMVVAGLLAACGSSSSTSSSSGSSASASSSGSGSGGRSGFAGNRAKLAACLKQHGVTLPARPAGSSGGPPGGAPGGSGAPPAGGNGSGGSGGSGASRGGGFFGGGGRFANNPKLRAAFQACGGRTFGGGQRFHLSQTAITKFVACVKQHGYDLPKPNFSGKGPVFPAKIEKNAKFQAASRACRSTLRPAGAPPASGSSSGGSS